MRQQSTKLYIKGLGAGAARQAPGDGGGGPPHEAHPETEEVCQVHLGDRGGEGGGGGQTGEV